MISTTEGRDCCYYLWCRNNNHNNNNESIKQGSSSHMYNEAALEYERVFWNYQHIINRPLFVRSSSSSSIPTPRMGYHSKMSFCAADDVLAHWESFSLLVCNHIAWSRRHVTSRLDVNQHITCAQAHIYLDLAQRNWKRNCVRMAITREKEKMVI